MIGQGHCVLCGIEILARDEAGEDALTLTMEAQAPGTANRVEWCGDVHPDCIRALWNRLAVGNLFAPDPDPGF